MPMSKTPRSTAKKLVARTTASGAQQYVRGKDAYDRVKTVTKAISAAKTDKQKQALRKARNDEMTPGAKARFEQYIDLFSRKNLTPGKKTIRPATSAKKGK